MEAICAPYTNIYGQIWINFYISLHKQSNFTILSIHSWSAFHLERDWIRVTSILKIIDNANITTKFEFKYRYEKNEILTSKVYKNKDGKLCLDFTGTNRWQNVLYFNSGYLFAFKEVLLIPKHSLWKNFALRTNKKQKI